MVLPSKRAGSLLALVLLCVLVYSNTLRNSFIWDDEEAIVSNQHIRSPRNIPLLFSLNYWKSAAPELKGEYRPVRATTFALDYFFWKLAPFGYHLTNLVLHILSVLLIYSLALNLKIEEGPAFFCAALFAAHPVHTESVCWIKNRSDLLSMVFIILSLISFIRVLGCVSILRKGLAYAGSLVCFIFALFSKETAAIAPLIFASYVFCFLPGKEHKKSLLLTLPFFAAAFLFYYFSKKLIGPVSFAAFGPVYKLGAATHILVVIKTLGSYIGILLLPMGLNAERPFRLPHSFFDPGVEAAFLLLALGAGLGLWFARRSKTMSFAFLWLLITLLPVSNIIFIQSRPLAEQRLYIPSFGFCLFLALVLSKSGFPKKVEAAAFILILIFYSTVAFQRNFDWKDSLTFWSKTVQQSPGSSRALYNLATSYLYAGDLERAEGHYKRTLELNPFSQDAYINLGNIYYVTARYDMARDVYRAGQKVFPGSKDIFNNLKALDRHGAGGDAP